MKTLKLIHRLRLHSVVRHVAHEPVHNSVAVEHNIDRKQLVLIFILSGGEVELHVSVKVLFYLAVFGDGEDSIKTILIIVKAPLH